jgi:hypothetical protein
LQYYFKKQILPGDEIKLNLKLKSVYDVKNHLQLRHQLRRIFKLLVDIIKHIEINGDDNPYNEGFYTLLSSEIENEMINTTTFFENGIIRNPLSNELKFISRLRKITLELKPNIYSPSGEENVIEQVFSRLSEELEFIESEEREAREEEAREAREARLGRESKIREQYFTKEEIERITGDSFGTGIDKTTIYLLFDYYVKLHKLQHPIKDIFLNFWEKVSKEVVTNIDVIINHHDGLDEFDGLDSEYSSNFESESSVTGVILRGGIGIDDDDVVDDGKYNVSGVDLLLNDVIDDILSECIDEEMLQGLEYLYLIIKTLKIKTKPKDSTMKLYISKNIHLITGNNEREFGSNQIHNKFIIAYTEDIEKDIIDEGIYETLEYLHHIVHSCLENIDAQLKIH